MVGQTSENVEANRASGGVIGTSYLTTDSSSSNRHPVVCGARSDAQRVLGNATVGSTTPPLAIKTEVDIKQESELAHDLETTFYGTYDEATNSITIIYPGEESTGIGIQECVQEVSTDDDVVCQVMDSDNVAVAAAAAAVATDTTATTTATNTNTNTDVATTNGRYLTPPPFHSYSTEFSPAYTCRTDTMSPASINSDMDSCVAAQMDSASSLDCGYESHDSPSVDSHSGYTYFNDLGYELFPALA